jgi:hypothetical protein
MSNPIDSGEVLKQLELELDVGQGSRFLLAVCDDDDRAAGLRTTLDKHVAAEGRIAVHVMAPLTNKSLAEAILNETKSHRLGAVHLLQAKNLPAGSANKIFGELNFQRDTLSRFEVPIIVWLYSRQVSKLASRAPDFWSRRTAIFHFDSLSIDVLLKRIFTGLPLTDNAGRDEISQALRELLSSERALNVCLSGPDNFSLSKADNMIQSLRNSAQKLSNECLIGKKIDVALWLWNASQMNEVLERQSGDIHNLNIPAYLDRNELLLSLAGRTGELLQNYLQQLDGRIRNKRRVSIIDLFISYATNIWRSMIQAAKKDAMQTLSIEPYDIIEMGTNISTWPEDIFRGNAAAHLESWLAGDIPRKPAIFSDEEADLLKYLYNDKEDRKAKPPIPMSRVRELLPHLQTKVRLFLGDITVG